MLGVMCMQNTNAGLSAEHNCRLSTCIWQGTKHFAQQQHLWFCSAANIALLLKMQGMDMRLFVYMQLNKCHEQK